MSENVFEQAFMALSVKMVQVTITAETLLTCTMSLIRSVKENIESNKYKMDDEIGPLLTYGDLVNLGPFWHNDKQVQSEMVTLLVGMLIGDLMSEYISPIDITLPNVFKLTTAVDDAAKTAKNAISTLLLEEFGDGSPIGELEHSTIQTKLATLMHDVVEPIMNGGEEQSVNQMMDLLDQVLDVVESRRQTPDESKGKTLH